MISDLSREQLELMIRTFITELHACEGVYPSYFVEMVGDCDNTAHLWRQAQKEVTNVDQE